MNSWEHTSLSIRTVNLTHRVFYNIVFPGNIKIDWPIIFWESRLDIHFKLNVTFYDKPRFNLIKIFGVNVHTLFVSYAIVKNNWTILNIS
jgi:hypothetical protein